MWYRYRNILVFILVSNTILLSDILESNWMFYFIEAFIYIIYLYINIKPLKIDNINKDVQRTVYGYELIVNSSFSILLELIIYLCIFNLFNLKILIKNALIGLIIILIPFANGYYRIIFKSIKFRRSTKIYILFLWWIPILNMVALRMINNKVRYEYYNEEYKSMQNNIKKGNNECSTRYPVVLVHGIFSRDWMFINYWGRIPNALIKHGACIYYGEQQSANSIENSAVELKKNILKIIHETNCGKVNIIAHSKGGLDSRYAISCLGLSKYTASLTTLCTPHRGCKYVDFILEKTPNVIKVLVAKEYNNMFIKFGDKNPDFLSGVGDLTAKKCKEFNKKVMNCPGVYYQSIASKMSSVFSEGFPLNIGYLFAKKFEGDNDGLVSVASAKWGKFLGVLESKYYKGISHINIVDLPGKNLKGFDVCEVYIKILRDLKRMGL